MKVAYTAAALADLRAIGRYIQTDSALHAKRFVRDLKSVCAAIGNTPHAYPALPRFSELGLRKRAFRHYLIIYRVTEHVEIFRVIHGARDADAMLGAEED